MSPVLELKDLRFSWGDSSGLLLDLPELYLNRGEKLFLQGPSGSGKTTLLNILAGVLRPQSGSLEVLNTDLSALTASELDRFRGDHFGFVFQMFNLLPYLSALDNVCLPCRFSKLKYEKVGSSWEAVQSEALRLLSELKLDPEQWGDRLRSEPVTQMSVGQQQRIATARALMGRPEIIVADEPTSALDSDVRGRFLKLLFEECEKYETTLIFVSHDRSLSTSFDRTLDLQAINRAARPSEVFG